VLVPVGRNGWSVSADPAQNTTGKLILRRKEKADYLTRKFSMGMHQLRCLNFPVIKIFYVFLHITIPMLGT